MNVARDHLRSFVERIERLQEEKAALGNDIRDIYAEAKAMGFDTKALRQIVKERGQDVRESEEFEAILDTYRAALGMLPEFESSQEGSTVPSSDEKAGGEPADTAAGPNEKPSDEDPQPASNDGVVGEGATSTPVPSADHADKPKPTPSHARDARVSAREAKAETHNSTRAKGQEAMPEGSPPAAAGVNGSAVPVASSTVPPMNGAAEVGSESASPEHSPARVEEPELPPFLDRRKKKPPVDDVFDDGASSHAQ